MTKRNEIVLHRDFLVRADQLAWSVIDDDTAPDELRADARDVEFALSEVLCYQSHGVDGERSIRLIPVGFRFPQFYTQMVDEFLIDLPPEVREDMPAHILMARQAAKYVDDALYSTDFRLDSYDALNMILAAMKAEVAGEVEEVVDDSPMRRP
jgi:hypothetical protein